MAANPSLRHMPSSRLIEPDVCGGEAEHLADGKNRRPVVPGDGAHLFVGQAECFLQAGKASAAAPLVACGGGPDCDVDDLTGIAIVVDVASGHLWLLYTRKAASSGHRPIGEGR